jgi:hypothetical protein
VYLIACTYVWGDVQIRVNVPSLFADIFRASIIYIGTYYVPPPYSVFLMRNYRLCTEYLSPVDSSARFVAWDHPCWTDPPYTLVQAIEEFTEDLSSSAPDQTDARQNSVKFSILWIENYHVPFRRCITTHSPYARIRSTQLLQTQTSQCIFTSLDLLDVQMLVSHDNDVRTIPHSLP